jgi:hypothetical protein
MDIWARIAIGRCPGDHASAMTTVFLRARRAAAVARSWRTIRISNPRPFRLT